MKGLLRVLLIAAVLVAAWFGWRAMNSLEGEPAPAITSTAWVLPEEAAAGGDDAAAGGASLPDTGWRLYAFFSPG